MFTLPAIRIMMKAIAVALVAIPSLAALSGFAPAARHDVHISYCQSEMAGNVFKGRVTYYKDDFLRAIAAWRGSLMGLTQAQIDAAEGDYVRAHFRILIGNQVLPWARVIKSENDKSVWFDLRAEAATRLQSPTLVHTSLFKEYGDQMNLMVLKAAGSEYNYIFTPSNPSVAVKL